MTALFVGGLVGASAEQVANFFSAYGTVERVTLPLPSGGYGFATVWFDNPRTTSMVLGRAQGALWRGVYRVSVKRRGRVRLAPTEPHEKRRARERDGRPERWSRSSSAERPSARSAERLSAMPEPPQLAREGAAAVRAGAAAAAAAEELLDDDMLLGKPERELPHRRSSQAASRAAAEQDLLEQSDDDEGIDF